MVGRLHRENLLQTRFEASLVDEHSRTGRETAVSSSADVEALRQLSSTLTRDSVRIGPTSRTHNRCLPHIERPLREWAFRASTPHNAVFVLLLYNLDSSHELHAERGLTGL